MAKKILVVVDAQNDFITGVLGNKECNVATNVIADEIRSGKYDDVIFTRDTHDENYLNTQEGRKLPVAHCIKGTNGWEVDARLKAAMKERGVDCDDMTYICHFYSNCSIFWNCFKLSSNKNTTYIS